MGLLVKGQWQDRWYDTEESGGEFIREDSQFRGRITAGGEFPAESGRYHLYVSLACPWAHRTLIFRKLKKLESHIGVSVVHPHMLENGWEYRDEDGADAEPQFGYDYHWQLYTHAKADYSGRVTVPVLWDKQRETIVNNESAEIIRIFNTDFNGLTGDGQDFYPQALRAQIDEINEDVYEHINNGVYRCGFATKQAPYEKAYRALFAALDRCEKRLKEGGPYLLGETQTEADWRLFTTLVRFDAVYYTHFKCNARRIADYPALSAYLQRLLAVPGVRGTVSLDHIKQHYFYSHETINPHRIVPLGPVDPLG